MRLNYKMLTILVIAVFLFGFAASRALGADSIRVLIDGQSLQTEVAPTAINDRTMVPMRAIFEALGATVDWDESSGTVTGTKNGTVISLTIGSATAFINGEARTLDVPAQVINERTMIPARFVSEALGAQVDWDADNQIVNITTSGNSTGFPSPSNSSNPMNQSSPSNSSAIDNPGLYEWNGVSVGMTEDEVESAAGEPTFKVAVQGLFWNYPNEVCISFNPESAVVTGIGLSQTNDCLISVGDPYSKLVDTYGQPTTSYPSPGACLGYLDATEVIYTTSYGTLIFIVDPDTNSIMHVSIGDDYWCWS